MGAAIAYAADIGITDNFPGPELIKSFGPMIQLLIQVGGDNEVRPGPQW